MAKPKAKKTAGKVVAKVKAKPKSRSKAKRPVIRVPRRSDLMVYFAVMVLMTLTGLLGTWFHFQDNVTSRGLIVAERFIRGAPIMAPLLYANVGLFGVIALLRPGVRGEARENAGDPVRP